jgi:UDP-3-O-[3-hydroxymyristoyl] glucosamine N-acyltransferase
MADPRFFRVSGPFRLGDLAEIAGAELSKDASPDRLITDVAPIGTAGPSDLAFLDNPRYLPMLEASRAGACVIDPRYAARAPETMALLLTDAPYSGYAKVAQAFYPPVALVGEIHGTAVVDPGASIGEGTRLGPHAVVGPRAKIGARCRIAAQVVIEEGVVVGDDTEIGPGASLSHCLVGNRCLLHAGVRVGNRGFGFSSDPDGYQDVPQIGRVIIEDDVEIGANSTVDRGSGPDTVIGAGSKIDNLVQIGHNVRIGRGCVLVAQSGVAGSTVLGDRAMLAGQAGVAGHLTLGEGARVAAKSGVMRNVPANQTVCGIPAIPIRRFLRLVSIWQRQLKQ